MKCARSPECSRPFRDRFIASSSGLPMLWALHLTGRWKGHEITVEVTGTLDGYRTATVGSEAVRTD